MQPSDIFEALVNAVRRSAELLIETKTASTSDVVQILAKQTGRIFVRRCLYFFVTRSIIGPEAGDFLPSK
jgi:hypothetical protein